MISDVQFLALEARVLRLETSIAHPPSKAPLTLKDARINYTHLICILIIRMHERGYQPAFGEGMDRKTPKDPTTDHMVGSLHEIGLAQDIDLYDSNGNWLNRTEDHQEFGTFWESLDVNCRWGGKFSTPDGNHYSYAPIEIVGSKA